MQKEQTSEVIWRYVKLIGKRYTKEMIDGKAN